MWNEPSIEKLENLDIPKLYATDFVHPENKMIFIHFCLGSADWYIVEWDGGDLFFGYVNLGDNEMAEWGLISFGELKDLSANGIEVDFDQYFEPTRVSKIPKIILR